VPARPHVTVITPTRLDADRIGYLSELHDSLAAQTLRRWEWILATDGADPALIPRSISADSRVRINRMPRHVGAATARNLSLLYASGEYVVFADDDDLLGDPDALGVRYRRAEETGLGWVAGQSADLLPDGSQTISRPLRPGRYNPGDVWAAWASPVDSKPPLGHTQLLTRTDLALCTGHGGLVQGEDYLYVLQVTGRAPGEVLPDTVYNYRSHGGQMTGQPAYGDIEREVRRLSWIVGEALHGAHRTVIPTPRQPAAAAAR
jgi:glycosyltransferase involved in cell wall biosynthesis